jgi:tRNA G46 methylase TrmB
MLFSSDEVRTALHQHLAAWGLKRFTTDHEYFTWQKQRLSLADLSRLAAQVEQKRSGDPREEVAFYDLAAQTAILPILYSQRYDYYEAIGLRIASRIGNATRVLDFGCGVGILTTFYAGLFPDRVFVGLDRSAASIAAARQQASELGLANVQFECVDGDAEPITEPYDLILSSHALVQHEQDPGIPSESWRTFARAHDAERQAAFERRTGVGVQLDRLSSILNDQGRMILFEKTRQLARRVPFQRALAGRGLQLVEPPESVRYRLVEEVEDDGPLYHVRKNQAAVLDWDELPESDEGKLFDPAVRHLPPSDGDLPLYENHHQSAQMAWERLTDRLVTAETIRQEPDGRQLHVELGMSEGMAYLYCANTFDQRQLVIIEPARAHMLETYYREIVGGAS